MPGNKSNPHRDRVGVGAKLQFPLDRAVSTIRLGDDLETDSLGTRYLARLPASDLRHRTRRIQRRSPRLAVENLDSLTVSRHDYTDLAAPQFGSMDRTYNHQRTLNNDTKPDGRHNV